MLDQLFGFILLGLGLRHPALQPNVLGSHDGEQEISITISPTDNPTTNSTSGFAGEDHSGSGGGGGRENEPRPTLRVLSPVLTKDQEEVFQKERKLRETKIKHMSDARTNELEKSFLDAKHHREQEDEASHTAFVRTVNTFSNSGKKQKVLAMGDKFQSVITNALTSIQKKLESMLTLLDKISIAAAVLQKQGKDISQVDSHITAAQGKITTALTLAQTLAGSLPTTLTVTSETTASREVRTAISDAKTKLMPLYTAFTEARKAVGVAVTDLESLTNAVDVSPTP